MRISLVLILVAPVLLAGRALFAAGVHYRLGRAERLIEAGDVDESGRVLDRVRLEIARQRWR